MDFKFSAKHNQLRETARRHAEEEVRPFVSEAYDTERFPNELLGRCGYDARVRSWPSSPRRYG